MRPIRLVVLTFAALLAFAANSLLCRAALRDTGIDAASFTSIRLISGALMLWLLAAMFRPGRNGSGNWRSAFALFAYAVAFSFAYNSLSAATGALLLFGAVQATMIGYGLARGEQLASWQGVGLAVALAGLVGLLLPGLSAPPLYGSVLMLGAGVAWGVYSILGKGGGGDPVVTTAGNFARAMVFGLGASVWQGMPPGLPIDGIGYAAASGALASGIGYAIWYTVLPYLRSTTAATLQLSAPVLAAAGGIVFLAEPLTVRFLLAAVAVLGGVALFILAKPVPRRVS
ncbi:MAG: DMT family transporter [Chromatiales bacterium]|nr:DMT family transporter [Chromatiales bacterium]